MWNSYIVIHFSVLLDLSNLLLSLILSTRRGVSVASLNTLRLLLHCCLLLTFMAIVFTVYNVNYIFCVVRTAMIEKLYRYKLYTVMQG